MSFSGLAPGFFKSKSFCLMSRATSASLPSNWDESTLVLSSCFLPSIKNLSTLLFSSETYLYFSLIPSNPIFARARASSRAFSYVLASTFFLPSLINFRSVLTLRNSSFFLSKSYYAVANSYSAFTLVRSVSVI